MGAAICWPLPALALDPNPQARIHDHSSARSSATALEVVPPVPSDRPADVSRPSATPRRDLLNTCLQSAVAEMARP